LALFGPGFDDFKGARQLALTLDPAKIPNKYQLFGGLFAAGVAEFANTLDMNDK
jgi:hypothetical protein